MNQLIRKRVVHFFVVVATWLVSCLPSRKVGRSPFVLFSFKKANLVDGIYSCTYQLVCMGIGYSAFSRRRRVASAKGIKLWPS